MLNRDRKKSEMGIDRVANRIGMEANQINGNGPGNSINSKSSGNNAPDMK